MKLPSGTYFIGDPCYVIDNNDWYEYLEEIVFPACKRGQHCGVAEFKGRELFWANTAFGDGIFDGCFVDSGMLGLTPIEFNPGKYNRERLCELGKIEYLVNPEVDEDNGKITLGPYTINTGDDDMDDPWLDGIMEDEEE